VTGGSGFIGSPLVRALKRDHEVISLSQQHGDIAVPSTFERLDGVDYVFHLAARTFVPDAWQDPLGFLNTNVVGTANVLAYCKRVSAALTFVSGYVYGRSEALPITERAVPRPNNPYALSKYLGEQLCEFAARVDNLPTTVVRPFNVYGERQPDRFLIPSILRQVKAGDAIRLKDLAPRRDYVHVSDLVALLVTTMINPVDGFRVFNAGTGVSYSVGEIVDLVQRAAHTSLAVIDEGKQREQEIADVRADISAAKAALGWYPRISLADGLQQLLASPDAA